MPPSPLTVLPAAFSKRTVALAVLLSAVAALAVAPAAANARKKDKALACGDVVKRDVRLTADLIDCTGNGLVVGRHNVSIDLNGHTIDGSFLAEGIGNGIDNSRGFDRVKVRGGTITNFNYGVMLDGATNSHLSGLRVEGNHHGMLLSASKGTVVEDCSVRNNGESIRVGQGIVVRSGSHRSRFVRMLIDGNQEDGIAVFDSDGVSVVASSVTDNYAGGVTLGRSADFAVLDSTLTNAGAGVWAHAPRTMLVRGNTILSYQSSGIVLRGSTAGRVEDNTILRAGSDGIALSGDRNVVIANRVRSSWYSGIAVEAGDANVVQGNQTSAFDNGIFVAAGVTDAYVAGNLATASGDDGIEVSTPSAVLADNTANDNADYGIEAVAGVTDGGGNRASGNGNPQQCTGVSCSSP